MLVACVRWIAELMLFIGRVMDSCRLGVVEGGGGGGGAGA